MNCPCCKKPLKSKLEGDKVILWCAFGPCPCYEMNDGARANTLDEAYAKLVEAFNVWWHNAHNE